MKRYIAAVFALTLVGACGGVATPSTPEEMRQKVASEMTRWRQVIEAGGIKVE